MLAHDSEQRALEEYIFIEPKKNFQLKKFKKLWRAPFGEKREDLFLFLQNHAGSWDLPDRDSPNQTICSHLKELLVDDDRL